MTDRDPIETLVMYARKVAIISVGSIAIFSFITSIYAFFHKMDFSVSAVYDAYRFGTFFGSFASVFIVPLAAILFPVLHLFLSFSNQAQRLAGLIGGALAGAVPFPLIDLIFEKNTLLSDFPFVLPVSTIAGSLSGLFACRMLPAAANNSLQGRRP